MYVGLRLIAAAAGVHPLFVDVHDYANMPWATAVYLAVVTACSNFLTGLCLGRLGPHFSPVAPLTVFWDEAREVLVFIDGVFQPGGHAIDIKPGLREIELRRGADTTTVLRAVPSEGLYRLDLATGELLPYQP